MNNRSHCVIKLKMIMKMRTIVIFVNNHEIQIIGSTIVQLSIFLLIPSAFLGNIH